MSDAPQLRGIFRVPSLSLRQRSGARGEGTLEPSEAGLRIVGNWARPSAYVRWSLGCGFMGLLIGIAFLAIGGGASAVLAGTALGMFLGMFVGRQGARKPLDITLSWQRIDEMHFDGTTFEFRTWDKPAGGYFLDVADSDKKLAASVVNVWLKRRFRPGS